MVAASRPQDFRDFNPEHTGRFLESKSGSSPVTSPSGIGKPAFLAAVSTRRSASFLSAFLHASAMGAISMLYLFLVTGQLGRFCA
jgi:hypothetical protein